ncbi:NAD(P)H-dependent glycerol-3-phosphate dehydrogenase [Sulfobacillus thermosulfidooxidans]|uniref:NAD(P)H-dependent glycerol-3-phosphate dehydrogenase n=1 Tax=Sulfobacillus thermosulfidooxidans TaxID=28034 RepID=UPI00040AC1ED|nr:NAD(P)H-dependent glycerol-3-phosphate dehydrogenase [Sulfobacillus thermosulfidooxidans]
MTSRLTIFGSGNWALTLADIAARSGTKVTMYVRRQELCDILKRTHSHPQYLTHLKLPSDVVFTDNLGEAAAYSHNWLMVVPSQHMRDLAIRLRPFVTDTHHVVSAAKGLEEHTALRMTQVLHDCWPEVNAQLGALSGPNLAYEISLGQPAASVIAGSAAVFDAMAPLLGHANLRLYGQPDIVGVELGGALKNVLAIAVGIANASGLGANAEAAIMTRGLHEMGRLAVELGAKWSTLAGLSGLGDVVATASSPKSRNRWLGQELAKGRSLNEIIASTSMVVEGVPTAYVAKRLGDEFRLPLPITSEVVEIFNGKPVRQAVQDLMSRERVQESDF